MKNINIFRTVTIFAVLATLFLNEARAHFPWLMVSDQGKPVLFFGEDLSDRTYHLPKNLTSFPLQQFDGDAGVNSLTMEPVETDKLVGLVATEPIKPTGCVFGTQTYGNYHGTKLVYFVQYCQGDDPLKWQFPPADARLQAKVEPHESGVRVSVVWNQKPLANAEVKLSSSDGKEQGTATTDSDGSVTFAREQLKNGLHAVMVGFTDKDASGTFNGEAFASTSNYMTATFNWRSSAKPADDSAKSNSTDEAKVIASTFPDLPTELTSFGGAIANGTLFVYGGHIGEAHSYSTAEQSDALWSLDLKNPKAWEQFQSGPKLQGLAMVAQGNSVIRFGGFTATNAEGEAHDLHSQASVARFDASTKTWTELTPLPEPRSSHAATIVGNRVYVVGGWAMSGEGNTQWHDTAWTADLSEQPIAWKKIATPPFQRRALALAAYDGKIFAIGGMGQSGGPTTRVDVFDPQADQWSEGPSLAGEPMTGFGCWAEPLGGDLHVSTVSGNIQRLSADRKQWQTVGTYQPGRFFHCMLPVSDSELIMVGGANMSVGRFTNLDLVQIKSTKASVVKTGLTP